MSDIEVYEQNGYRLIVNRPWCKGCDLCVKSCPAKILYLDGEAKACVSDIDECIFCGICVLRCPDFAISLEREEGEEEGELEREGLEVRVKGGS
ncbi:MAG: ferredoxin family protein [Candidatus Bipolaricaulia bacterium]